MLLLSQIFLLHTAGPCWYLIKVKLQDKIRLYDGDKRTEYENGVLELTSHRLIWRRVDTSYLSS
jgi:hypothetical protein